MHRYCCLLILSCVAYAQGLPKAFRDVETSLKRRESRFVTAGRFVAIQSDLFDAASASSMMDRRVPIQFELNLFDDVRYTVALTRVEHTSIPSGGLVWTGKLDGLEHSEIVLAVAGDIHTGTVRTGRGEVYRIRNVAGLVHEIEEVDTTRLPKPAQPKVVEFDGEPAPPTTEPPMALADDGSTIDILVVYTSAARQAAGGPSQIESQIATAIASTNQGYLNSGIIQRLRLVGTSEVAYTETGSEDIDLDRLTSPSDGHLDSVHVLRNSTRADIVSLWVENMYACGIAWLFRSTSADFASKAFNVVQRDCAVDDLAFGHELGHNMGATHDITNSDSTGYFPYSYGYQQRSIQPYFRTVMAYPCSFASCPIINYYSSPANRYSNIPTGISSTDNVATLNGTRNLTSNFRQAVAGALTIAPLSNSVGAAQTTGFITVTASAGTAWTAVSNTSWIVITSGTQGSGSGTVNYRVDANATSSSRTGTITIGGVLFTIEQAAGTGTCTATPLSIPQSVTATLSAADCLSTLRPGRNARRYTFNGVAGQKVGIAVSSSVFDVYAMLLSPTGTTIAQDDDSGNGTDARIPASGFLTLPSTGLYTVEVTSYLAASGGSFTITLSSDGVPVTGANGPFRFVPMTPCRVADSRGNGLTGTLGAPRYSAGETRVLAMRSSACGIPSDARAYSLNFTVVPQGPLGFLTTWPSDQPQPLVSTLNSPRGTVLANAAIVPAAADGSISVYVSNATDVIVDINGYFAP